MEVDEKLTEHLKKLSKRLSYFCFKNFSTNSRLHWRFNLGGIFKRNERMMKS